MTDDFEKRWSDDDSLAYAFLEYCRDHYAPGDLVAMQKREQHSDPSRRHFFACVGETWNNLKEPDQKQYNSKEHLRHWVTIQAGYYTCEDVVCLSTKQAAEMVVQIAKVAQRNDPYAIVTVRGNVIRAYYARSLKSRGPGALSKKEFQDMKEKALVILSDLIGTDVDTLLRNVPMPADNQPSAKPNGKAQPAPEPEPFHYTSSDPLLEAYENWRR